SQARAGSRTRRRLMALRMSLKGRVATAVMAVAGVSVSLVVLLCRWAPVWLAGLAAILISIPVAFWLGQRATRSWTAVVQALRDGIASARDHDFSVFIQPGGAEE